MFKSGDLVAEHLQLVRLLGAGGMGSVWIAEHLRLRTQVAVKFLSATMLNNPAARTRFDREAQLVAQVKSPHVVQVLDQGVTHADPPQPYIVMELLEGEDLSHLIDRAGKLSLADAIYILNQVCSGLSAAHAVGLVHRDIKPENIFLMNGDRPFVKILDFGIARATQDNDIQRLTHTGGVIGTAHFMSPEQLFEGKQVDLRTDVWALGVVLYKMLTGALPFDGSTYGDLCVAVHQGIFIPPSQLAPLPPGLDSLMARTLAGDRNQRFASVKEFALELNTFATGSAPALPYASGVMGSAVPAVTAGTADRPGTGSRQRNIAPTQQMQTDVGATLTVEAPPMHRPGIVTVAALGLVTLAGLGFGAAKLLSSDEPVAAGPASSAPPALTTEVAADRKENSGAAEVVASNPSADVKPSGPAPSASVEPSAGAAVKSSPTPGPRFIPKSSPVPKTPAPSTPSTSKSHDPASEPPTGKTAPPAPAKEKYRGF